MSEIQIKTSVNLLYVLFAGMGLVSLWDIAGTGLDGLIGALFCIFLVYFAYEKRSRAAASVILIDSLLALVNGGARAMGYDFGLMEEPNSHEVYIITFFLNLFSIVPAYILVSGCFRFHKLNESKTNWKNVIKLTAGIFVYCFALGILLSLIFDPYASPTTLETALFLLVIVSGLYRKLPGTAEYITVVYN